MSFVAVATVAAGIGAGLSAYGSYQQGQAVKAQNQYQSDVLAQQAILQQRQADENQTITNIQAAEDSKAAARRNAAIAGLEQATLAGNGVFGVTSNDIALDTFDSGKLDQQAIQYNAALKNWGTKEGLSSQLWSIETERTQHKFAGRNAVIAGNIQAGTSLLKGASQVASFGANGGFSAPQSSVAATRANTSGLNFTY